MVLFCLQIIFDAVLRDMFLFFFYFALNFNSKILVEDNLKTKFDEYVYKSPTEACSVIVSVVARSPRSGLELGSTSCRKELQVLIFTIRHSV